MTVLEEQMKYQVIDGQTKQVVGTYTSKTRARRAADRKDLEYGAIRYHVQAIENK
jgi:hypothetical protein